MDPYEDLLFFLAGLAIVLIVLGFALTVGWI